MATRADFYVKEGDKYTLIGCTMNNYSGPFEKSKTSIDFIECIKQMLDEGDTRDYIKTQTLPYPWTNSKLTDECFIFEIEKPKFWQFFKSKNFGKVYRVYKKTGNHNDVSTPVLALPIKNFKWEDFEEDTGEYIGKLKIKELYLPELKK